MTKEIGEIRIPCPIESGIWRLVARAIFKDRKSKMRELISNSVDAIGRRLLTEPDALKRIVIMYSGRDIVCEDWGTGIVDLKQFVRISVPSYKLVERLKEEIGYFGVGKTSFILESTIETVLFESVTSENGMILDLRPDEIDRLTYSDPKYRDRNEVLTHIGLRVTIKDVSYKKRMPVDELVVYLGETFAPKVAIEKYEIIVRDQAGNEFQVEPPNTFRLPSKEPLFILPGQIGIPGVLKKGTRSSGKIKIYRRGVKITDPLEVPYKVSEESYLIIESDSPPIETITAGRDSLQVDTQYHMDLKAAVMAFCEKNKFERIEKGAEITKKASNSMAKAALELLEDYMSCNPEDTPPEFLARELSHKKTQEETMKRKLDKNRKRQGRPKKEDILKKTQSKIRQRKNKKHRHFNDIPASASASANSTSNVGDVIEFVGISDVTGDPIEYNKKNRWFDVRVNRPSGAKVVTESRSRLSKATRFMLGFAVAMSVRENVVLNPGEFSKKLWEMMDKNLSRGHEDEEEEQ